MATIYDRLKEQIEQNAGLKEGISSIGEKEEKKAPDKKKEPLFTINTDEDKGKVSLNDLTGIDTSYKDVFTVMDDEFWPEEIRNRIPSLESFKNYRPNVEHVRLGLIALEQNINFCMIGPPGTGKTELAGYLCALTRRPLFTLQGESSIEREYAVGYTGLRDGSNVWFDGIGAQAAKYGGVFFEDEYTKIPASVNMCFQGLRNPQNRYIYQYGHPDVAQQRLVPKETFRWIAADNSRGVGDNLHLYSAASMQDNSFINGFGARVFVNYLSKNDESELLLIRYPGLSDKLAMMMATMASLIRDGWNNGTIQESYSPRNLMAWAQLIFAMGDVKLAFKASFSDILVNSPDEIALLVNCWRDCGLEKEYGRLA